MNYRYLDIGEQILEGDLSFTAARAWVPATGFKCDGTFPIRRIDDGCGEWVMQEDYAHYPGDEYYVHGCWKEYAHAPAKFDCQRRRRRPVSKPQSYRLLDFGEVPKEGDEFLTLKGWVHVEGRWMDEIKNPIRRPDDGKGKYILVEKPSAVEMTDDRDCAEFWLWGTGWVQRTPSTISDQFRDTIWRKARDVGTPAEASAHVTWVVMTGRGCTSFDSEAEARAAAREGAQRNQPIEYRVQQLRDVATYKVDLIVTEINK